MSILTSVTNLLEPIKTLGNPVEECKQTKPDECGDDKHKNEEHRDDRDKYANRERFPDAGEIHTGEMDEIMASLAPGDSSYIVIVTRGHRHDLRVLRWALETPAHYIGMIGSSRKVLAIYQQLESEGVSPESFKRVFAPIGLDIQAATPEEIGIAIVAELIAIRRGCDLELPHSRNRIREEAEAKDEASLP